MPKRFLFVVGTFLLTVLLYVDRICISTAKEPIMEDLKLTENQFGWMLAVFSLGYALFQTPGGYVADRFSPRKSLTMVVAFCSSLQASRPVRSTGYRCCSLVSSSERARPAHFPAL
jgi:MFS transporter, ACS family, glucarate transporter